MRMVPLQDRGESVPVRVRPATERDLEELCELLVQLFSLESDFRPDRERARRGLVALLARADAAVLVAEASTAQVLGMITVQSLISTAEGGAVGLVEDVVVHEGCRGRGVGALLVDAAQRWARRRGHLRLQLLADLDNAPARRFYAAMGWTATRLGAWRCRPCGSP
jgi:GNAT superfamily N-acetyltransferase